MTLFCLALYKHNKDYVFIGNYKIYRKSIQTIVSIKEIISNHNSTDSLDKREVQCCSDCFRVQEKGSHILCYFSKAVISGGESVSLPLQFLQASIFAWGPPSVFKTGNYIPLPPVFWTSLHISFSDLLPPSFSYRTPVISWGPLHNPAYPPNFKILKLITQCSLPCKVVQLHFLQSRIWASKGRTLFCLPHHIGKGQCIG